MIRLFQPSICNSRVALKKQIGQLLFQPKLTLAITASCTGGLGLNVVCALHEIRIKRAGHLKHVGEQALILLDSGKGRATPAVN